MPEHGRGSHRIARLRAGQPKPSQAAGHDGRLGNGDTHAHIGPWRRRRKRRTVAAARPGLRFFQHDRYSETVVLQTNATPRDAAGLQLFIDRFENGAGNRIGRAGGQAGQFRSLDCAHAAGERHLLHPGVKQAERNGQHDESDQNRQDQDQLQRDRPMAASEPSRTALSRAASRSAAGSSRGGACLLSSALKSRGTRMQHGAKPAKAGGNVRSVTMHMVCRGRFAAAIGTHPAIHTAQPIRLRRLGAFRCGALRCRNTTPGCRKPTALPPASRLPGHVAHHRRYRKDTSNFVNGQT